MAWLLVFIAGVLEIFWPLGLKFSETPLEWAGTILIVVVSYALLIKSYEELPAGTVYAVYTGMGSIGIFLVDAIFLGTPANVPKIIFFAFIVVGVLGLKLSSGSERSESDGLDIADNIRRK